MWPAIEDGGSAGTPRSGRSTEEVNTLKDRLEVRKLLIDRAKELLQSEHGLYSSEPQAFRWIQKTSMDRRLTMREVAQAVVDGTLSASPSSPLPKTLPADSNPR